VTTANGVCVRRAILLVLLTGWATVNSQTTTSCEAVLSKADDYYQAAKYDSALLWIPRCFEREDKTTDNMIAGYQLLGKIYVARGEGEEAKKAFIAMFGLSPFIQLDSREEGPAVVKAFNDARIEFLAGPDTETKQPPAKSTDWLWIAVGGSIVVLLTALIL
jgi:hypothetical protein